MSRQLSTGVIGRRKKDDGLQPAIDMFAWFDSAKIQSAINEPVVLFPDSSANGYDATQPFEINAPILRVDSNGNKYTDWDGGDRRLVTPSFNAKAQPNTIFAVISVDSEGTRAIFDGVNSSNRNFLFFQNADIVMFAGIGRTTSQPRPIPKTLYRSIFNEGSSSLTINGDVNLLATVGTQPLIGITIGSRFEPLSGVWQSHQGRIYELIFYNRLLSEEDTEKTNNYLSSKYNITMI